MVIRAQALRAPALSVLAFTGLGASCALSFPDYEVDEGSTGAGAGAATQSASDSTSSGRLPDGAPCNDGDECLNNHCLRSNTGEGRVCCAIECRDMGPANCATNGNCDAQGGSCAFYPSGEICGQTASCVEPGMRTSMQCLDGSCEHVLERCLGNFLCADAETCKTQCVTEADCIQPEAECIGGRCIQPDGAPCTSNDQCASHVCGATGVGHCCSKQCDGVSDPCGPTDCDTTGQCDFPTTLCGGNPSCMGATLTSEYCDGMGSCGETREARPCPGNLLCDDALSCYETCGSNDSTGDALCTQGNWCDGVSCVGARGLSGFCNRGTQCLTGICITLFGRCL